MEIGLRTALLSPKEISVNTNLLGSPLSVSIRGLRWRVTKVRKSWRDPVFRRSHYRLLLSSGATETIFQDPLTKRWYHKPF